MYYLLTYKGSYYYLFLQEVLWWYFQLQRTIFFVGTQTFIVEHFLVKLHFTKPCHITDECLVASVLNGILILKSNYFYFFFIS